MGRRRDNGACYWEVLRDSEPGRGAVRNLVPALAVLQVKGRERGIVVDRAAVRGFGPNGRFVASSGVTGLRRGHGLCAEACHRRPSAIGVR